MPDRPLAQLDDDGFTAAVLRYFDGGADEAALHAIRGALGRSDAHCRLFVEVCEQAAWLRERRELRERRIGGRATRWPWRGVVGRFAAAAAIVLGLVAGIAALIGTARRPSSDARAHYATLTDVRDAAFGPSDLPTTPGSPLSGGFLKLTRGQVELTFDSGAQVTVTGPAEFGINSASRGFLRSGKLVAFVPKQARGFTVGAPGCAVIDLGTRYAMKVDGQGVADVEVLEGTVEVRPGEGGAQRLGREDVARVWSDGRVRVHKITKLRLEPVSFEEEVDRSGSPGGQEILPVTGPLGVVGVSGSIHTGRSVMSLVMEFKPPAIREGLRSAVLELTKDSANYQRNRVIGVELYAVLAPTRDEAIAELFDRQGHPLRPPSLRISGAFIPPYQPDGSVVRLELANRLRAAGSVKGGEQRLFVALVPDRDVAADFMQRVRVRRQGCAIVWVDGATDLSSSVDARQSDGQ